MIITSYEICKTCKFYIPLYVKDNNRFKTIMGHCVYYAKTTRNRQKPFTDGKQCEFKEPQKEDNQKQNESIKQTILKMSSQLSQILYVLNSE